MCMNLLVEYISVGVSALYALIGFAVVFAGIALLVLVVWAVGKILYRKQTSSQAKQREVKPVQQEVAVTENSEVSEINEETVAVIMAALTAYYQTNNPKCEFTVKRIKRI